MFGPCRHFMHWYGIVLASRVSEYTNRRRNALELCWPLLTLHCKWYCYLQEHKDGAPDAAGAPQTFFELGMQHRLYSTALLSKVKHKEFAGEFFFDWQHYQLYPSNLLMPLGLHVCLQRLGKRLCRQGNVLAQGEEPKCYLWSAQCGLIQIVAHFVFRGDGRSTSWHQNGLSAS